MTGPTDKPHNSASPDRNCCVYNLMISAGEASGDAHGAHAIEALKHDQPDIRVFGMGAGHLRLAGTELIVDCRDLAVIGFVDVLLNYHKFLQRLRLLRNSMRERKPDLLVLVDFPDFNLKLAETARELGIPVLFYVSPQIWAWRAKRIHRIGKLVDHMAVLFAFEVPYYERENIPVTFTGNPLVDDVDCDLSQAEARAQLGLDPSSLTVALLPGSRQSELSRHLPVMLEAADWLTEQFAARGLAIQSVLPRAQSLPVDSLTTRLSECRNPPTVIDGNAYTAMRAANAVIVASGTATLETALVGTPMVLIYRMNRLNYALMRRLIKLKDIGLVNIVAGQRIVPELLQHDASAVRIGKEILKLLDNADAARQQRDDFARVRDKLGAGGASKRVAALMLKMLQTP